MVESTIQLLRMEFKCLFANRTDAIEGSTNKKVPLVFVVLLRHLCAEVVAFVCVQWYKTAGRRKQCPATHANLTIQLVSTLRQASQVAEVDVVVHLSLPRDHAHHEPGTTEDLQYCRDFPYMAAVSFCNHVSE